MEIEEIVANLPDREGRIVKMRFGLIDGVAHTLEETGREYGVTRQRIRQIEAKALERIKQAKNLEEIKEFLIDRVSDKIERQNERDKFLERFKEILKDKKPRCVNCGKGITSEEYVGQGLCKRCRGEFSFSGIRGGRRCGDVKMWREEVLIKDNFTCQKYHIKGGKLHAHHIFNYAQYPDLRFVIANGITLSEKAHREFHHLYGVKNNTKEQIEEFLKTGDSRNYGVD